MTMQQRNHDQTFSSNGNQRIPNLIEEKKEDDLTCFSTKYTERFDEDRASINKGKAKKTDLRKLYADPKQILDKADQARMKKLKVLDDKSNAKATDMRKRYADQKQILDEADQARIEPGYE